MINFLVSLTSFKDILVLRKRHMEPMRGTFKENEDYCSKANRLTHFGVPFVGKGGRTDRNEVYQMLKEGFTDVQLMEADFSQYCRFRNGIADYRSYQRPERKDPLEIYLFFGEPGTGKTKFAIQQLGKDYYRLPVSQHFWLTPSMCGKKMVLIDEFRANLPLHLLLQILDENPVEVARKNGFVWWCPDVVVITTNRSPWRWYDYNERDMERQALFRRFTGTYIFRKNVDKVPRPEEVSIESSHLFEYDAPHARQDIRALETGMLI